MTDIYENVSQTKTINKIDPNAHPVSIQGLSSSARHYFECYRTELSAIKQVSPQWWNLP